MLFTGNGDAGYTEVIGGASLPKNDLRLEALGALDEAQAHLGLARALLAGTPWADAIERVQANMRVLMSECATIPREGCTGLFLTHDHLRQLENDLELWEMVIGGFNAFVTPGDTMLDAHLHLARAIVRRAERQVVAIQRIDGISSPLVMTYLNRLSSWIYALAIVARPVCKTPEGDVAA